MAHITGLHTKALANGSPFPLYKNGTIRFYNMRFCPFAQRALLVMTAKKLTFEVVNVHLMNKPKWFLDDINPLGKVPVIQFNDKIIYESLICSEWADDFFAGPKVLPSDPYKRAKQKLLADRLDKLPSATLAFRRSPDEKTAQKISDAIQLHENLLENTYFAGNECGWVDYMAWPFLERLEAMSMVNEKMGRYFKLTTDRHPKLVAYVERMKARPEVKISYQTPENHIKYLASHRMGRPNFDVGLVQSFL